MRVTIPTQHIAVEPSREWLLCDEEAPGQRTMFGFYMKSVDFGIYVNVRGQDAGGAPLTRAGMVAVLHDQTWASPAFDEWSDERHDGEHTFVAAGGVFEMTSDRSGDVVLEAFLTDGQFIANLATPGDRKVIAAATPAIIRLSRLVSFT